MKRILIAFLAFLMLPSLHASDTPQWIGAITREQSKLPEGRHFHSSELNRPEVKALWATVDTLSAKSILLRREFQVAGNVKHATMQICGLGHYELSINGRKVGDALFAPLWSDYDKRVYFNEFDVTKHLRRGENALGVLLGNGFYNVQGGRYRKLQISFGPPTLYLQLRLEMADGTVHTLVSNRDWRYALSPFVYNNLYGGETYDARLEQKGWDSPRFDDRSWSPAVIQEAPRGVLTPQTAPPVKIGERFQVKSVKSLSEEQRIAASVTTKRTIDPSARIFDMGQNLAGFPEIEVRGRRGQKITIYVGESLTEEGAVNQRQTGRPHFYEYILKGEGAERWHPHFSYYGYRYIQVEGAAVKGEKNPNQLPQLLSLNSCFIYNSAPKVSSFECSNEIFNQAHRLIDRAVRSNMQSVFTDCPHREKLGWLEQVHLNGPGLLFNYDLRTFLPKVLQDIEDAQYPSGMIPTTAPQYVVFQGGYMDNFAQSIEWASTFIISAFQYYEFYGDDAMIVRFYDAMSRYVDYLATRADNHILSFGLGDWYDYGDFRAGFSRNTPVPLVATAYYYQDLKYMERAARMTNREADAVRFARLAEAVRTSFNQKFFDRTTGQYGTGSQCSNAMPLFIGLVDEKDRGRVLNNLVQDIQKRGNRLTTGDVGNRYLFQALAKNGLDSLMYIMHNHEEAPGYGFQLKYGATTLTEQWDPRQGASWNHFMMGQIDEWFFRSLAGIGQQPGSVGFRHLEIRPQPVGDLRFVNCTYQTPHGKLSIRWTRRNERFTLRISVPDGADAVVYMPGQKEARRVEAGSHTMHSSIQ